MKNQRKEITDRISTFSFSDFDGFIDSIIENLLAKKQFAIDKGYKDIRIEYDYGWGRENDGTYEVFGTRPETDKEMNKRLVIIQKSKETKKANRLLIEKKEYAQYLKLKEKYGDESKY